jgi:hypothetical protein
VSKAVPVRRRRDVDIVRVVLLLPTRIVERLVRWYKR